MHINISGQTFITKRTKTGVGGDRAWSWWGGDGGERGSPRIYESGLGRKFSVINWGLKQKILGAGVESYIL